ncbi:MAG: magnesium transporter CorA family protein [Paracoccus sp. (in: a-proteobacteria)]|uniref:magnesium transporter CorA family protein n=1 Tax=Paracoccus sp. TaxID=267 RepID=UPI0026E00099|nr:magnesium transporter CorA family protein [Paracoccus sp. (in: a-proteobacteria)]MDO5622201.1 magnesium transporter CorA family protein [Paracoccus sp. (in: a-proteobacteria)]
MLNAYRALPSGVTPLPTGADLAQAQWIDLYRPLSSQTDAVEALGLAVPTLADMEEIEISNRLYQENGVYYMTIVLPGETPEGQTVAAPVTFILAPDRLVTVRHHAPRPFSTFPSRADRGTAGCGTVNRLFLSLIEEIISRLADILEAVGRVLDEITQRLFEGRTDDRGAMLQKTLEHVGQKGDVLARIRLGLLSVERLLSFYNTAETGTEAARLKPIIKAHLRDIQALEVHADFLAGRVTLAVDATLGLISLRQNDTVRILSVVTALFLPPTLIASTYGMNFDKMPELHWEWGYPYALGLMLASAVGTWLVLKWKKWM